MALVLSVASGIWRTQIRTERAEEHEGGEGDDPGVGSANCMIMVELEEPGLGVWMDECGGPARGPSANRLFKQNIRLRARPGALVSMSDWYPIGPKNDIPSTSARENSRSSMKKEIKS